MGTRLGVGMRMGRGMLIEMGLGCVLGTPQGKLYHLLKPFQ